MAVEFKLSDYYIPLPKQRIFHESDAKYKLFMGGVGSGKSMALCWEALLLSLEYPGNYGLIGRLYYPELRDTTMHDFFEICPGKLIAEYKKTEHKLTLLNGSVIIFRALEDPDKLKSLNLGWFGIDEMTETPEDVFLMLQSRIRRTNVPRRVGFGSTNPEGHDWVYQRFAIKHADDPKYLMVNVSSMENKYLPDDYVDDLISSYDEVWVKRYIHGDPTAFEGQIIRDWNPPVHVIKPFDPPEDWARIVVLDHGTNNPTAVLWGAVHPENFIVIYREHYAAGEVVDWHAQKIYELNGSDNVAFWYADPSIFNRTLQDPKRGLYSIADLYAELGLHFTPADNDVKTGIDLMKKHFHMNEELVNPFTQAKGSPRVFITEDCPMTIREVPQYRWRKLRVRGIVKNQPEEPEKSNDHTVDCLRYMLMARPQPTKAPKEWRRWRTGQERFWDAMDHRAKIHERIHKGVAQQYDEKDTAERARILAALRSKTRRRKKYACLS